MKKAFYVFVGLQVADFITTLLALRLGGAESNPMVALFMHGGPIAGLLAAKLLALAIGAGCMLFQKRRAIHLTNIAFTAIVTWNVTILARLLAQAA